MSQYALAAAAASAVKLEASSSQHGLPPIQSPTGPSNPALAPGQSSTPRSSLPPPASASSGAPAAPAATYAPPPPVQHKRVYQACIPCRRRKVRCDLGSVDNPNDPPCVRCRRESKDCYFSATRRKRRTDGGSGADGSDPEHDEYIIRNGRKRVHVIGDDSLGSHSYPPDAHRRRPGYSDVPLTPGGSQGRSQPLRRPGSQTSPSDRASASVSTTGSTVGARRGPGTGNGDLSADEPNTQLENYEARSVMRREVYGPHDALDLLYKAATDSKRDEPHSRHHPSIASHSSSSQAAGGRPVGVESSAPQAASARMRSTRDDNRAAGDMSDGAGGAGRVGGGADDAMADQPIDPELMGRTARDPSTEPGYAEALRAWARFRFVRAGWFTAPEAIEYIDYYYEFLSPLTPISPPTFQNPASHLTLLTEEPILTVTLLTIASRYKKLPGTGGHCRSHAIHEQLWTYLRGMIERCLWGQEAFGGGFCGVGSSGDDSLTSSTAPWRGLRKGSLRTLGTIESLMILTEWHPRALHFPPAEATDELMLPSYDTRDNFVDDEGNQRPLVGGKRIESWLEPAWRSDRMCWMLLSTAMGLAYELGVFDDIDEMLAAGAIARPEYEDETYRQRAYRIKRLLLIYLTQLAGRLGWTNMVPESLRKTDPAVSRKRPTSVEGTTPGTVSSSLSNTFNYIPDLELDDQIIHCWAGISNAMHIGNEKLFRSRKHTTEIIQSNKYITLLKEFQPMLREWWKEFERFRLPPYIRHILTIEYEYVRIYINSLSLQAVVERCTSNAGQNVNAGANGASGGSTVQLSPQTQNYYGKLPLGQLGGFGPEDQEYVKEVVDGCRNLLRTVVEGLLPGDYLKHAPVRTYFRIISGAMFLLKTFALGAPKSEVWVSISLMDQTVNALRNCVVDDVHLGIRFADLLESLTSRLRNRFIQASTSALPTGAATASAEGRSPIPSHATDGAGANGTAAVNGNGAAADGQMGIENGGSGLTWPGPQGKMRDLLNGPDRSDTPVNANISATPFDLSSANFPYAGSVAGPSTPAATSTAMAGDGGGLISDDMFGDWAGQQGNEMWYLPAGPAFFQNVGDSAVAMTAEGVNVGGMDLLEYMAMDQFPTDGNPGY